MYSPLFSIHECLPYKGSFLLSLLADLSLLPSTLKLINGFFCPWLEEPSSATLFIFSS